MFMPSFKVVTTTTIIHYLTITSNLVELESWHSAQIAAFFILIITLILFVMFGQSGEELLMLIYPILLCSKVVTTTTTLHLDITSKLFELESWGCAQNEAFFK